MKSNIVLLGGQMFNFVFEFEHLANDNLEFKTPQYTRVFHRPKELRNKVMRISAACRKKHPVDRLTWRFC